jgi:hypothetical protein
LAKFEVAEGGKAEHGSNGIPPGDRCECESKILPWDLREALGNKTGFEARNFAEFVTLYVKYPLASDSFSVRGELVNLLVYAFGFEGCEFLLHGREPFAPVRGAAGFGDRCGV